MQTRIYKVTATKCEAGKEPYTRLVEASSAAQAIRHVVASEFTAHVPTTKEVAAAMQAGIRVERAGEHNDVNQGHAPTTEEGVTHGLN